LQKNPCDHAQGGGNGKHSKKVSSCNRIGHINATPTKAKLYLLKRKRKYKLIS